MSSAIVAELEAGLQAMLLLKPPGVSGSRIQGITTLCMANVQFESVLVQKLYTHFRKAPGSHKLGVLYVVDSVTRKWTDMAVKSGQPINNDAQDGTFAAGVNRVKELLPALMNDIIQSAPDDQKEKIRKLVDIWEKGQTFPPEMLTQFKDRLNAPKAASTTPPGSPPVHVQPSLGSSGSSGHAAAAAAISKNSSILEALANLSRQNNTAPPPAAPQPQETPYNTSNAQNTAAYQSTGAMNQSVPYSSIPPPVNIPNAAASFAPQPQGIVAQNYPSNQPAPYANAPTVAPPTGLDPTMQQQLMLIKALADQGLAPDKLASLLAALGQGLPNNSAQAPAQFAPQYQNQNLSHAPQNGWVQNPDETRDRNGYQESVRSPQGGRFRQRSRSRSPSRAWNAAPNGRNEQNYDYDHRNSPNGRGREHGNEYRQRSPPRRGHSPSPPQNYGNGEKWTGVDHQIPRGSIKVLSRTLFVGGVTMPDHELRRIFDNFGSVQTCIVNKDKRHAFVKMVSREDAVRAKEAMEKNRAPDSALRTRWGVGFGPRDCSDYQTGVSVIPISKLTDADRKWMLSAEYGGTGGKPIESNMVVEEPDIEIGQGVSSKAISRRMATDKGGNNGPKSSRDREEDDFGRNRRHERSDRREDRKDDNATHSTPAVPQFGGGFPFMQNGMPVFPPGFLMGGAPGQAQPPPPGRHY